MKQHINNQTNVAGDQFNAGGNVTIVKKDGVTMFTHEPARPFDQSNQIIKGDQHNHHPKTFDCLVCGKKGRLVCEGCRETAIDHGIITGE